MFYINRLQEMEEQLEDMRQLETERRRTRDSEYTK